MPDVKFGRRDASPSQPARFQTLEQRLRAGRVVAVPERPRPGSGGVLATLLWLVAIVGAAFVGFVLVLWLAGAPAT